MTNLPLLLVVDDNQDNAALLARRLRRRSFQVLTTDSGEQALRLLEEQRIDLVLLDILMRDMDGMQTLQQIRHKFSLLELPVIMASALTAAHNMVAALTSGANDYVTRPLDMDVVVARIRLQLLLKQQGCPEKPFI
jgi:two-component system sensor histidine kinase ChiS